MSYQFHSSDKLLSLIKKNKGLKTISDVVIRTEVELTGHTEKEVMANAKRHLSIMKESICDGLKTKKSRSGMTDGEASLIKKCVKKSGMMLPPIVLEALSNAIAVVSSNACMGRIVAAPTAGSSGILPACLFAAQKQYKLTEDQVARALLAASGIGIIAANKATLSGAKAGCQAEVGVSAAMAAAAISEVRGLTPEQCVNAAALALKNLLGLACDPIAGLVEVPCVKRNAFGVTHAITASELSAMGVKSFVPFDDVLVAMNNVAKHMAANIRETSQGGLAVTVTGQKMAEKLIKMNYK